MTQLERKIKGNKYLLARYLKALNTLDAAALKEANTVCDAIRDDLRVNMRHDILDACQEILRLKELFWANENIEYLSGAE